MAHYSKDGNAALFQYFRGSASFIDVTTGIATPPTPQDTLLYYSANTTLRENPKSECAEDPTIKMIESACPNCSKPVRTLMLSIDATKTFLLCRCGYRVESDAK